MFLNAKTYWMYPPSCSTGSLPAAKAYFVTPPPLGGNTVGRGILDAPFPSHHKHRGISEAWHRRRPGGPSRYSATIFRACRVIPMRVTRGAASSAQATDRSLPGRPESSFPPLGLLSPPNPLRWASAGAPITASANGAGGDARPVSALSVQPAAAMTPRTGGPGWAEPPGPSFSPFLREEMGAPAAQARPSRGPPVNGRRAGVVAPHGSGRMISAPAGYAGNRLFRPPNRRTPPGVVRFRTPGRRFYGFTPGR